MRRRTDERKKVVERDAADVVTGKRGIRKEGRWNKETRGLRVMVGQGRKEGEEKKVESSLGKIVRWSRKKEEGKVKSGSEEKRGGGGTYTNTFTRAYTNTYKSTQKHT